MSDMKELFMKRKRMALFALALCVVGSALLTSCGTKPVSMASIYEQVRSDAANGHLEKAKADWKEAVMNASASEKLPDEVIQAIKKHDIFPDTLPCFTLPEELDPQDILNFCDGFCWLFFDMEYPGFINTAGVYPAEWFDRERGSPFAIMEKQTAEQLVSDYFGFQNYSLREEDLLWWWNYGDCENPDFENLRSGDTFCYVAHDPDPPSLIYKSERSLGNGFFYVVFEQGWYNDNEEPTVLQDLHLVIRVTDNFFGYQLISILQNDECSLL